MNVDSAALFSAAQAGRRATRAGRRWSLRQIVFDHKRCLKMPLPRRLIAVMALSLSTLWMQPAWAAPDAAPDAASGAAPGAAATEAAAKLATTVCATCHGPLGAGDNPRIPRLAGQQRAYLEVQLKAFRNQSRGDHAAHEYMWAVAAKLDDKSVTALAGYFAAQKPAPGRSSVDSSGAVLGKDLFEKGRPERGLPACTSCHGVQAEGMGLFPRLAGQHGEYLFVQLQSIRNKLRESPVMHGLIKELTDDEVVALAAYLESK
jgi:cytochrome c553